MLARIVLTCLFLSGFIVYGNGNPFEHLIAVQRGETTASQLVRVSDGTILAIPAVGNLPIIFEPKWSSDYRYIAFLMGSDGRGFYPMLHSDVFLLEYETGIVKRLTEDVPDTLKTGILWGPDDKSLIVSSDKGIELIVLETGKRIMLMENKRAQDLQKHYSLGVTFTTKLIINRFMSYIAYECKSFDDCTNTVNIYDFVSMSISHQIPVDDVFNAVLSHDMATVAVLGIESTSIYRVQDRKIVYSLPMYISSCAFSNENKLYCVTNDQIYTIDLDNGTSNSQTLNGMLTGFGFGTTSDQVLALNVEGEIALYTYSSSTNISNKILDGILYGEETFGLIISGRIVDW